MLTIVFTACEKPYDAIEDEEAKYSFYVDIRAGGNRVGQLEITQSSQAELGTTNPVVGELSCKLLTFQDPIWEDSSNLLLIQLHDTALNWSSQIMHEKLMWVDVGPTHKEVLENIWSFRQTDGKTYIPVEVLVEVLRFDGAHPFSGAYLGEVKATDSTRQQLAYVSAARGWVNSDGILTLRFAFRGEWLGMSAQLDHQGLWTGAIQAPEEEEVAVRGVFTTTQDSIITSFFHPQPALTNGADRFQVSLKRLQQ